MKLYRLIVDVCAFGIIFKDNLYFTAESGTECEAALRQFLECYMPTDEEDPDLDTLKEKFLKLQHGTVQDVAYDNPSDVFVAYKVYKPFPVKPAVLQYDGRGNATIRIEIYPWQEVDWPLEEISGAKLEIPAQESPVPDAHLEMAYEDRTCIEEA